MKNGKWKKALHLMKVEHWMSVENWIKVRE